MPRQPRIEYEGAIYHVLSRGDRREDIVAGDEDRRRFRQALADACGKCDWQVHAWVLMRNHFHLVIETPLGNLAAGMKWFLGTYTMAFNRRHQLGGHLFAGRYKSLLIDDADAHYLRVACDYVHLNPARAGIVRQEEPLETYAWSSLSGLPVGAPASAGLAASGPAFWRAWSCRRGPAGPRGIEPAHRSVARRSGCRRPRAVAFRLALRRGGLSGAAARPVWRAR